MRFVLLSAAILCVLVQSAASADWPCWRGPSGLGVSSEEHLPDCWSDSGQVTWKADVPGKGASSPIIVGSHVFLTTQFEDTGLHVLAFRRDSGQLLWDQEIGRGKLPANQLHNMATPTPVSDGHRLWALFGTGDLACLDFAGKRLWHRNLVKDFGPYRFNHGYGSSPMLAKGTLFIPCMHQGPSYLLGVDANTGRDLWKVDRTLGPSDEAQDSYSSPLVLNVNGQTEVILEGAEAITGYEPLHGRQLWALGGLKVPHPYGRTIAGLAAGEGIVIGVASGFQNQGYTVAVQPPQTGQVGSRIWTCQKYSPDCPTPVVYRGRVFMIRDDGMGSCLNLRTGQPLWQERLFAENVKVSPVAGAGKIYFVSGQGTCLTVDADGAQLRITGKTQLHEPTISTPALAYSRLFIRTDKHLYAVE